MQDRVCGEAYRTTQVCIDSYEHGVPVGCFYNLGQEDEVHSFNSLSQMLVGMEHMLDSIRYPQAFTAKRSFAALPELRPGGQPGQKAREGQLATFVIRILFRQHTSWQGSVTWVETKGEQTFRSVLELILLMDSALNDSRSSG